jgi:hypothetical protein
MKSFDLGVFPWYGYLELSFLTEKESNCNEKDFKYYIADWKYYNFTKIQEGNWKKAEPLCEWMKDFYSKEPDTSKERAEIIFKACAEVLLDKDVTKKFKDFHTTTDFEKTVYNPGDPDNYNYCSKETKADKKLREILDNGINTQDENGSTALSNASHDGENDLVKLLIENNADIELTDKYGFTPFMVAAYNGHMKIVKMLHDNGADIDKQNDNGNTALSLSCDFGQIRSVKLLMDYGANPNTSSIYGLTPLMAAITRYQQDVAKFLIKNGVDINARCNDGKTALAYAKELQQTEIIELLKKHNAHE